MSDDGDREPRPSLIAGRFTHRSSRRGEYEAAALATYPASWFAWWVDHGFISSWPPEITPLGKRYLQTHGNVLPDPRIVERGLPDS